MAENGYGNQQAKKGGLEAVNAFREKVKNTFTGKTPKSAARVAGVLYLGLIVFGVAAQAIRDGVIIRPGDGAATVSNILENESLFRIGFVLDLLMILAFAFLSLAYLRLFKDVNKNAATMVVVLVLVCIPMMFVTMLFYLSTMMLSTNPHYLTVFGAEGLQALVMFFFDLYTAGVMINTIFHGLYLFPLGYLVYKSNYFPKVLGTLLIVAAPCFLMQTVQYFVFPGIEAIILPIGAMTMIAEFAFCGFLLIKGVREGPVEKKPIVGAAGC